MTLKDIPIGQYQKLQAIMAEDHESEWAKWAYLIAQITDKPVEFYLAMKVNEFKPIIKEYSFLVEEKMPDEWVKEFECEGERFKVVQRTDQWDMAQFISMGTLTKDKGGIVNNLHMIIATLSVKELGEFIPLHEFNRRAELFQQHLSCVIAYPIALFYAAVMSKLSVNTRYSLIQKRRLLAAKKKQKRVAGSVKNGVGMKR